MATGMWSVRHRSYIRKVANGAPPSLSMALAFVLASLCATDSVPNDSAPLRNFMGFSTCNQPLQHT